MEACNKTIALYGGMMKHCSCRAVAQIVLGGSFVLARQFYLLKDDGDVCLPLLLGKEFRNQIQALVFCESMHIGKNEKRTLCSCKRIPKGFLVCG